MGFFSITFSDKMNMVKFLNTTTHEYKPQSRNLRSSGKSLDIQVYNASEELDNSYKYLFNSRYLDV